MRTSLAGHHHDSAFPFGEIPMQTGPDAMSNYTVIEARQSVPR